MITVPGDHHAGRTTARHRWDYNPITKGQNSNCPILTIKRLNQSFISDSNGELALEDSAIFDDQSAIAEFRQLFIVGGHKHDGVPQAGIIDQTRAEFGSK